MKKVLINVSNHPSEAWSQEQKAGWDEIFDIQFPAVNPNLDTLDAEYQNIELELKRKIYQKRVDIYRMFGEKTHIGLCLQGEFSLCYRLFKQLHDAFRFYIPTTERTVVEKDNTKTSVFKFVRWRVV